MFQQLILLLALLRIIDTYEVNNRLSEISRTNSTIQYNGSLFNISVYSYVTLHQDPCAMCSSVCNCDLSVNFEYGTKIQTIINFNTAGNLHIGSCIVADTTDPLQPIEVLHYRSGKVVGYCVYNPINYYSFSCNVPKGVPTVVLPATFKIVNGLIVDVSGARLLSKIPFYAATGTYYAVRESYFCLIKIEFDWLIGFSNSWVESKMSCWICSFCKEFLDEKNIGL